jgi:antitoxin component of RelBE/YafQ-DinJ toxin-antitoxin module
VRAEQILKGTNMNQSIGFIGGGRVARIFLEGWARAGKLPVRLVIADPNAATLARLKVRFPAIETTADLADAAAQDVVFPPHRRPRCLKRQGGWWARCAPPPSWFRSRQNLPARD